MAYIYRVYPLLIPRARALWLQVVGSLSFSDSCIHAPTLTWRPDGSLVVGFLLTRNYDLVRTLASYSSIGWIALDAIILPRNEEGTLFAIPDIADEVVGLHVQPTWSSWKTPSHITHDDPLCLCRECRDTRGLRDEYTTASPYPGGITVQYRLWDGTKRPAHPSTPNHQ